MKLTGDSCVAVVAGRGLGLCENQSGSRGRVGMRDKIWNVSQTAELQHGLLRIENPNKRVWSEGSKVACRRQMCREGLSSLCQRFSLQTRDHKDLSAYLSLYLRSHGSMFLTPAHCATQYSILI